MEVSKQLASAGKERIVLIGAGNVATHLGIALQQAGWEIAQVYSRTEASASELGNRLQVPFVTSIAEVHMDADVYIVSVKDDALKVLIQKIKKKFQKIFGKNLKYFLKNIVEIKIIYYT